MNDLLQIIRHRFQQSRWPKILFLLASVGVIISTIINLMTPPSTDLPQSSITMHNITNTNTSFQNIRYSGEKLPIEPELPLFSPDQIKFSTTAVKEKLLSYFSLKAYEDKNNVWVGSNYSMLQPDSRDGNSQEKFVVNYLNIPEPQGNLNTEMALQRAENYLKEILPDNHLQTLPIKIKYLRGFYHLEPASPSAAQWVEIPFYPLINEKYAIYTQLENEPPVSIKLNHKYEIVRLTINTPLYEYKSLGNSETISLEQALANINNNINATIVSAYQEQHGELNLDKIVSGNLDHVSIEYRLDNINQIVYPFYKFSGLLINEQGIELQAQVLTPAIKDTLRPEELKQNNL